MNPISSAYTAEAAAQAPKAFAPGLLLGLLFASGAGLAAESAAQTPAAQASTPATTQPVATHNASAPSQLFAIRQVRVFDGERVLPSATVLVRDGLIAEVGGKVKLPADVPVIDGAGQTLLPGLIDSHVHAFGEARGDALRFGVTTELDMFTDYHVLPTAKAERESRAKTEQADLWSAGTLVTAKGGHGTEYGFAIPTLDDPAQAQAFVDARIAEGSDYIKLVLEQFRDANGKPRMTSLSEPALRAAIKAAHARKRLAVVHVSLAEEAALAIDAGADGLVHINGDQLDDPKLIAAIKRSKAFVVPTLTVMASVAGAGEGAKVATDPRIAPWLQQGQKDTLGNSFRGGPSTAEVLNKAIENVRRLHAAGVPLLAGTDAGNPGTTHGASEHGELDLLVRAGLTPVEALRAATSVPAQRFGLSDRGRIAPGLRADLLLVDGDPSTDITATRAIRTIWKNGYALNRSFAAKLPAVAPGVVALFKDGKPGERWLATSDSVMGGKSSSALDAGKGSAGAPSLSAKGELSAGFPQPWAGLMFNPAPTPMGLSDARAVRELSLRVRGDGHALTLFVFSGPDMNRKPGMQTIPVSKEWQEVRVPLASMPEVDLGRLRGIAVSAMGAPGPFGFEIEAFELR